MQNLSFANIPIEGNTQNNNNNNNSNKGKDKGKLQSYEDNQREYKLNMILGWHGSCNQCSKYVSNTAP